MNKLGDKAILSDGMGLKGSGPASIGRRMATGSIADWTPLGQCVVPRPPSAGAVVRCQRKSPQYVKHQ